MRTTISIFGKNSGLPKTGYTLQMFAYSTGTSGYTGSALYSFTDNSDGTYYADISTTIKGTVVITTPAASTVLIIPDNYIGRVFWGDNIPTIEPGGTT
jgi:hypothetical protein